MEDLILDNTEPLKWKIDYKVLINLYLNKKNKTNMQGLWVMIGGGDWGRTGGYYFIRNVRARLYDLRLASVAPHSTFPLSLYPLYLSDFLGLIPSSINRTYIPRLLMPRFLHKGSSSKSVTDRFRRNIRSLF
jgi:hypothetical protein